jgi:hypothetical protein
MQSESNNRLNVFLAHGVMSTGQNTVQGQEFFSIRQRYVDIIPRAQISGSYH